ncbi:NADPH-dependent FMN reductase [Sinisalibacter aestuarii]|uniref:NAD(P)H-dependent FMN reductase n=1 Tax=Sinisalibacter aestuarii TaxID=2949426 RepID=A0ABQ5LV48_9RHOB|nr:NAD(P)H-dependent oxidoreductase [Sinisalibacter aestuarii]GKY88861.1 NAD(P)H-dependent FMN reductase [Sinisalibacter aestuarii]
MSTFTLLGISGSLRQDACNRRLLREAVRTFGEAEYVEADIRFPLFDEDLQNAEGIPPEVARLAEQIAAADAVMISTPEYNKNLSGVLKNALDWVSRVKGNPWKDKPVVLMAAADGRAGGERAMHSLILCMMPFRANLVYGPEVFLAGCDKAFDESGRLTDAGAEKFLGILMRKLRGVLES